MGDGWPISQAGTRVPTAQLTCTVFPSYEIFKNKNISLGETRGFLESSVSENITQKGEAASASLCGTLPVIAVREKAFSS